MNGLNQAFSCPIGSYSDAPGELNPIHCPIIYCPSTEDIGNNYTASICVKVTTQKGAVHLDNFIELNGQLAYDKSCLIEVCGFSCDFFKSEEGKNLIAQEIISKQPTDHEYNLTISVGCRNGDFRSVENQTVVLPESTIETFQTPVIKSIMNPNSSSNHLQANLNMSLFILFIILMMNTFTKRALLQINYAFL